MSLVRPFRGIRYDLSRTGGDPSALFCPPDDQLTPSGRRSLLQRSPWNFLRVQTGRETADSSCGLSDSPSLAEEIVKQWLQEGILVQDRNPSFYLYRQTFTATVGGVDDRFTRTGLVALLDPIPEDTGTARSTSLSVFLHSKPLSSFQDLLATTAPPVLRFLDDHSVEHSLQVLDSPEAVQGLQDALRGLETVSLEGPSIPGGRRLALLVSWDDPGLVLRPVHRIYRRIDAAHLDLTLRTLRSTLAVEELPYLGADAAEALLATVPENVHGFALRRKGADTLQLLTLPSTDPWAALADSRALETALERPLLGTTAFRDPRALLVNEGYGAMDLLDSDPEASLAVLLRPVTARALFARAASGPSEDAPLAPVHPRPWSGLVSLFSDG